MMNRISRLFCFPVAVSLLAGCAVLQQDPLKPVTTHLSPPDSGLLKVSHDAVLKGAHEEESAFKLLFNNAEALRWRLALIDHATTSIDLQVFIWQNDETGRLLIDRLIKAAKRGVRVRLLVDDFPLAFDEEGISIMADDPNIDIRIFNPAHIRSGIISPKLEWGVNFEILNCRMHNKQMIVDNCWAVLGGRNIGNPYFGLDPEYNFRDVDLLISGPVTAELSGSFDLYWNCDVAYPGTEMADHVSRRKKEKLLAAFSNASIADRKLLKQTPFPIEPVDWSDEFSALPGHMHFGVASYFHDAPIVRGDRGTRLLTQLREFSGTGKHDTVIVSPYLIPSDAIMAYIKDAVEIGGSVRILTASMASNNHTMTNSKYKKYRKPMLKSGAEIREFRGQPGPAMRTLSDTFPVRSDFVSLHIKAFMQDQQWVYIGSLNMDPRAVEINTENILAIDSPELAAVFFDAVKEMSEPENAWEVYLNENNRVRWKSGNEILKHQPARSFGQRCTDWFFRWMPVESQL